MSGRFASGQVVTNDLLAIEMDHYAIVATDAEDELSAVVSRAGPEAMAEVHRDAFLPRVLPETHACLNFRIAVSQWCRSRLPCLVIDHLLEEDHSHKRANRT